MMQFKMTCLKLTNIKKIIFFSVFILLIGFAFIHNFKKINIYKTVRNQDPLVFRFHIRSDLEALDPMFSANTISSYILNALHSPLLKYQQHQITSAGAQSCLQISKILYECVLRDDWRWSDGQKVTSEQIVDGFRALNNSTSPRRENFLNISSVQALSSAVIRFKLKAPDHDFLFRLIDPTLSPRRADINMNSGNVTSGPYYLYKKKPGRSFYLKPNTYFNQSPSPIHIEILVVDSDDTALRLYQTKKINFLRRLPADKIEFYKNSPDFFQVPFFRFDYIGFGPSLLEHTSLRKNLIYSLGDKFEQFIKIFHALGAPGCFGFLPTLFAKNKNYSKNLDRCFTKLAVQPYNLDQIKKLPHLTLQYSMQGEDDIRRAMELFQNGWQQKLSLQVELQAVEQGVYTEILKRSPPPLFRRGVSLERPTCLAALEVFESTNPNNFIKFQNKRYDQMVQTLRTQPSDASTESLCTQALDLLLDSHRFIPLGAIHFSMLTDHKFDNFYINELNQLDVTKLSSKN